MKKEIIVIFLLLLFTFPAVKSLLSEGGFTAHDLTHHVVRQIDMHRLLSEGQFPPRWSGELAYGYGYPVFLFNYPLPALLGEVFYIFGLNFVDSVKAVLFTSMIISVLGMYLFLKSLLGSSLASFLGAIFYLYAPIRFIYIYVSASVGSALALGILPFIFWSLVETGKGKKRATFFGALSFALLVLAHNVTTLIFTPMLLVFTFLVGRKHLYKLFTMFLLGLGLSAWFWLPAIFEKQYIRFDEVFNGFYKDQFINLWQLIRSPWGYGLSHPRNPQPGDMSYQLGLIHILVILTLIPALWFLRKVREVRVVGGFVAGFFLLSVFLMLKISESLWDNLHFLSLVQFPLRFSSVAIFVSSIAVALLIKYLPYRKILFIFLVVLVIYANRNHWRINESFNPGEEYYLNLKTTTASLDEHLPKWAKAMGNPAISKFEFINGEGRVNILKQTSHQIMAQVEATTSSNIRFNQFYFPGWEIKVDNKKQAFNYLTEGESYGLPVFDINSDKHQIIAEFKNTPVRNLADFISLASVVFFMIYLLKSKN